MKDAKQPDGEALIRAKRGGGVRYEKEVNRQRELGFSDAELARAMAGSRALIDAVGPQQPHKQLRHSKK